MYSPGFLAPPVSDPQVLAQVAQARLERAERLCEHGRPYVLDATGHPQTSCFSCADFPMFQSFHYPPSIYSPAHDTLLARRGSETSAFSVPQNCLPIRADRHGLRQHPYDSAHPVIYGPYFMDPNNGARRKAATKETTHPLKVWLSDHRKNPYPTKAEKILLAIMTKMSLTQVSTWFANARRRLKKENKMNYESNSDRDDATPGGGNSPAVAEDNTASNGDNAHASGSEKNQHSDNSDNSDVDLEVSDLSDKADDLNDPDGEVTDDMRVAYKNMLAVRASQTTGSFEVDAGKTEAAAGGSDSVIVKAAWSPSQPETPERAAARRPMTIVVPNGIQSPRTEGSGSGSAASKGKIWSVMDILESSPKPPATSPSVQSLPAEAYYAGLQYPVHMAAAAGWQFPSPLTMGHHPHSVRLSFPPGPSAIASSSSSSSTAATAPTATVSAIPSPSCSPVRRHVRPSSSSSSTEEAERPLRLLDIPSDSAALTGQTPGSSSSKKQGEEEAEALNLKTEPQSDGPQSSHV